MIDGLTWISCHPKLISQKYDDVVGSCPSEGGDGCYWDERWGRLEN